MRSPVVPHLPPDRTYNPKAIRILRWSLMLLIFELTFEGLARKLNIKGTNVAIFLLKDAIVAAIGIQVLRMRRPATIGSLWTAYIVVCLLFVPPIIATALHDPVLAVFGAKEYLLYPMVGFAIYIAFEQAPVVEIISFYRWFALLVIPTAAFAILELRLPASNWLNLSVEGANLDAFSAAGHLRVSSTFPFVAQYCAFINTEVFVVMIALNNFRNVGVFRRLVFLSLVPLLIISSYVTGSRGAVLVNIVIIAFGFALSLMRFQARSALRVIAIIVGLLITLVASQYAVPDAFAAYQMREQGQLLGASSEIQGRIYGLFFDWMDNVFSTPLLGNGLGVMSNGSEMISHYAAMARQFLWTETDLATTLFEGGLYLMIVWYGFRYFVIYQCVRRYLSMKGDDLSVPAAFVVGNVITIGVSGTLGIQPPIAIWWWLGVGTALLFWWKSVEPKDTDLTKAGPPGAAPPVRKVVGQSAYAARLHANRNSP